MAVEPGDRHIIGDLQPQTLAFKRRADRKVIVGTEDTVKLRIFAARLTHQLNTRRVGRRLLHHHAIGRHPGVEHRLLVPLLFDDSSFIETRPQIGDVAVAAGDNRCGHLPGGFKVIKPDSDIEARRPAVHQLHHRNAGDFNHLQGARRMSAFGEDQAVNVPGEHRFEAFLFHFRLIAVVRQHGLIAEGVGDAFDTAQHFREDLVS